MRESIEPVPFPRRLRMERFRRGWSQNDLADQVGVDLRTIRRWEKGETTPRPTPQQRLCSLLRLTPEDLGLTPPALHLAEEEQPGQIEEGEGEPHAKHVHALPSLHEMPPVAHFSGRQKELTELRNWVLFDHCAVVAILGIGGVGKTSLAAKFVDTVRLSFDAVFWCSLQNAPPLEQVIAHCIQILSPRLYATLPLQMDEQITLLLSILGQKKCLLIFDNMESVVQSGQSSGFFVQGYEPFRILIRRIAESKHKSCLLLTSREKPDEISLLERPYGAVRTLPVPGVDLETGRAILQDKGLAGKEREQDRLIERYSGNPLALQLTVEPIRELFGGSVRRFLEEGGMLFSTVNHLLAQQIQRLSLQEYALLCWLAIERERITAERLRENLLLSVSKTSVLDDLKSLKRRSLIESYQDATYTLQPVIMEYISADLIERFVRGCSSSMAAPWLEYALMKAQSPEYVRESQERFLLGPVAHRLLERQNALSLFQLFQHALQTERKLRPQQSNYLAANALHVLHFLGIDLHGLDCSDLVIWQAHLQSAQLPGTKFSCARFHKSTFINMSGNVLAVAFSPQGKYLAVGTANNEIWLYEGKTGAVAFTFRGHSDAVWSVAFSPDGRLLASSSDDGLICLWDTKTGRCLKVMEESEARCRVKAVAFSPDGKLLASGSDDCKARIWSVQTGKCEKVFAEHTDRIWSVAFSPDGRVLATGSTDQSVRLWNLTTGVCLQQFVGHQGWVLAVAFSPDGAWLASGGDDCTIRLWSLAQPSVVKILAEHDRRVRSLSFHLDGIHLASASEDQTVRVWDIQQEKVLQVLKGHTHGVRSVAFDARENVLILASGADDQTTRIWDVENGHCLKTFQGYTNRVWTLAFSPDGQHLVSGSEDQNMRVWQIESDVQPRVMQKRGHGLRCLAYSPDAHYVATGGEDCTIRIWEASSGLCIKTLSEHTSWIRAIAYSHDGQILASGSEDHAIFLWRTATAKNYRRLHGHSSWIRDLAFSPDGQTLASCSDDKTVRLWSLSTGDELQRFSRHTRQVRAVAYSSDGQLLASAGEDSMLYLWNPQNGDVRILTGHEGWVRSVAFSPDGKFLVSGGDDLTVRLWDVQNGACLSILRGHTDRVRAVAFHPQGILCASSSDDGTIRLWDIQTRAFVRKLLSPRPYEGMLIHGVQGLTEAQILNLRALGAIDA